MIMSDFVNNIEVLQFKAPKDLPDVNSVYIKSAEQTNVCITQQIRNAMKLAGVELPENTIRSDAVDPLFLSKTIQQYASFAQSYIVDPSSTANDIIITPSVQNKQLQTVLLVDSGTQINVETTDIDGTVDAQVFDELPNGGIFQFLPLINNTSSIINVTVRIKRLKWDVGTLSQIVEIKDFTYPVKGINGVEDVMINDIRTDIMASIVFDKDINAFRLTNSILSRINIFSKPNTALLRTGNTTAVLQPGKITCHGGVIGAIDSNYLIDLTVLGIGGLDVLPLASLTGLYVQAYKNNTTGAIGFMATATPATPTIPSGWTLYFGVGLWSESKVRGGFISINNLAQIRTARYNQFFGCKYSGNILGTTTLPTSGVWTTIPMLSLIPTNAFGEFFGTADHNGVVTPIIASFNYTVGINGIETDTIFATSTNSGIVTAMYGRGYAHVNTNSEIQILLNYPAPPTSIANFQFGVNSWRDY
jgi:hypothetical protein